MEIGALPYILNSIAFPLALIWITFRTRNNKKISSISNYVVLGGKAEFELWGILFLGNFIQFFFSLYLYFIKGLPETILLTTLGGILGMIVSFFRLDKHAIIHNRLTILSLLCYSGSMLYTSILLVNPILLGLALFQILGMTAAAFNVKTKYLEVFYFALFGAWNIILLISLMKG